MTRSQERLIKEIHKAIFTPITGIKAQVMFMMNDISANGGTEKGIQEVINTYYGQIGALNGAIKRIEDITVTLKTKSEFYLALKRYIEVRYLLKATLKVIKDMVTDKATWLIVVGAFFMWLISKVF